VIEADADRSGKVLASLQGSGILDADVATTWAEAERLLAEREYDAVVVHERFVREAGSLLGRLEPDAEHDPLALILLTSDHGVVRADEAARQDLPGLGIVAEDEIPRALVPCLQATLAAAGIRCRSAPFCTEATCRRGY
jgi:hypothetical protein